MTERDDLLHVISLGVRHMRTETQATRMQADEAAERVRLGSRLLADAEATIEGMRDQQRVDAEALAAAGERIRELETQLADANTQACRVADMERQQVEAMLRCTQAIQSSVNVGANRDMWRRKAEEAERVIAALRGETDQLAIRHDRLKGDLWSLALIVQDKGRNAKTKSAGVAYTDAATRILATRSRTW